MTEKMRPIYDYSVLYHLGVIESAFPRNKGVKAALRMVRDVVNTAPTVSPDEVRGAGKWIRQNVMSDEWYKLECSNCRKEFEIMEGDIDDYVLNYCPNCGSKNEFKEEY